MSQDAAEDAVKNAVTDLSRGSDAEDLERAARGKLIELDVLDRVRRVRLKRKQGAKTYNDKELLSLTKVTHELFDPKGKHCDR